MLAAESNTPTSVVTMTQKVIAKMYAVRDQAKHMEVALPDVGTKLDAEPAKAKAAVEDERAKLERDFEARLRDVKQNASLWAMGNLTLALRRFDALDAKQIRTLRAGLEDVAGPTAEGIKRCKRDADVLQSRARRTLDPLYSMGDRAEDQADKLGDSTGNAEDAILKVADRIGGRLNDRQDDLLQHAEESL